MVVRRFFLFLLLLSFPALANTPEIPAKGAILLDVATDTVLYEKNASERLPPASMSKIMTAYMTFEALKAGRLKLDQKVKISEAAWRMQGSKTFVALNSEVKVEDLIRGMVIQSGNDATVALAEAIAGTESGYAAMANEKAKQLGMTGTNFANATGWPDPMHYSTVRDLANLAEHLMIDFPEHYHYYSEKEFTYHNIRQQNRNPLLYMNLGADGIKTGHTDESGFSLIGSAVQNGRRLLLVVAGLPDDKARADEAARLLQWGFAATGSYTLFKKGSRVDTATVWLGRIADVPLVIGQDVTLAMTKEARAGMKAEVKLMEPVPAPVVAGQKLGTLTLTFPGLPDHTFDLVAGEDVERLGFLGRLAAKFRHAFGGEG